VTDHVIQDPARRERAREYARIRRRLFLVELALSGGALLLLIVSGAAVLLRDAVQSLSGTYHAQVALYTAVVALGASLLFFPLSYYAGFVLPHRYGLSVQTTRGWIADHIKGTLIGLVQAIVVALPVYTLLRQAPQSWWLWAAVILTLFAILLTNLAPILIVPLFFKLTPLADADLRRRLLALGDRAGARITGVFVMDMSRRTRTANAALMGIGNTRRIVLGDTLWQRFAPEEIEAILAHELGHHVHGDLSRGIALQTVLTFGALWAADRVLGALTGPDSPLAVHVPSDPASLPILLLVAGVLFTILMPLTNGLSRRWEAAADRFAVRVTGNAEAWKGALRKLADQNLAEVDPPRWVEWLLYSHPSIRHRLEAASRQPPP